MMVTEKQSAPWTLYMQVFAYNGLVLFITDNLTQINAPILSDRVFKVSHQDLSLSTLFL